MLNDDDFSALPNSTGQNSQQQKGLSGTTSGNDELKRRHRLAIEGNEKVGIQTHHDGRVTNIPPGMLNDQFGMAGLLTFLRTKESAPSIVGLALGHDLTNLGLNLNSSKRNLYQTFGGPWADFPCRIQDLDTKVPEEYLTNATIRDKLPNIKLNKLHEDVLFYLFYNCPGEVYQVAAASELYARDWRFHKSERFWLQRAPFSAPPREIGGTYERCQYNVFDPIQWRRVPREMVLEYKDLEGKPTVSGTNQQSSSSAGAMPPVPKADGDFFNLTVTVLNQLKNISQGMTIQKSEIRQLIYFLNENPEILGKLDNGNQFFNFLQYEPEIAGFYLAYQLMYDSTAYFSNLDILLNMNVNVQTLIAINKFVRICEFKSLPIPGEFLNKFVSLCISTCDRDSTHDLAAHRLVRMVCVFLDTLLGFKHFDPMTMRAEIQNFVTSYLNLREASQLYQKTLQI